MPKVNVYLPDDLAEAVRESGVPVSAICQRALEQAVRRLTAIREATSGTLALGSTGPLAVHFTKRAMTMLQSAQHAAREYGLPETGTDYLLAALIADENGIAARVLTALEIAPQQISAALASRMAGRPGDGVVREATADVVAGAAAGTGPAFSPEAAEAIHLAAAESSGLGHHYVGSEHLLLGLIGEPEGTAGSVLRSFGAELRVTRRTVAAALAGWAAHQQAASPAGTATGHEQGALATLVSATVQAELAPLLSRIERLEKQRAH